jgi:hypothetical protein
MSSNLSLSFELICLMGWLLKHEQEELSKLIENALGKGLSEELQALNPQDFFDEAASMNVTVHEFFECIERMLLAKVEGIEIERTAGKQLEPALKKMDSQVIDLRTLWTSLQQAKKKLTQNKKNQADASAAEADSANKVLFEQILKNWNPSQIDPLN